MASELTIDDAHFIEKVRPGCGNAIHDNAGTVSRAGNQLTLTTTAATPDWPLEEREFTLVPWAEWLYLVEADRAMAFCNAVNTGERVGRVGTASFHLRDGDESRAAPSNESLPDVPPEWNKYIVHMRLCATTTDVQAAENATLIDLGTEDGVFEGLEFIVRDVPVDPHLFGSDRVDRVATVTRAEAKRSRLAYRNYKQRIPTGLTVETGVRFKPEAR